MSASQQALAAVRAAKNVRRWGAFAALMFIINRQATLHALQALAFEARRKARSAARGR